MLVGFAALLLAGIWVLELFADLLGLDGVVGENEGVLVGREEVVGEAVDGEDVGEVVGLPVGLLVGLSVGEEEGALEVVGDALGLLVGPLVGALEVVGEAEGLEVGVVLGELLGDEVGAPDFANSRQQAK